MSKAGFFLEIVENGVRIPVGNVGGYETEREAFEAAKKKVDDALPYNRIRVFKQVAEAYLAGDGSETINVFGPDRFQ